MLDEPRKLTLLTYQYPDDMLERRGPHREAHLAHAGEWEVDGKLLMAGAVGDPPASALFVFDCPADQVESFADSDPYFAAGLVLTRRIESLSAVAFPEVTG